MSLHHQYAKCYMILLLSGVFKTWNADHVTPEVCIEGDIQCFFECEFLGGCGLLETVINSGSLSQWGSAVEDTKISRAGDSVSEHNQRRGQGHKDILKDTHVQIYSNLILQWLHSSPTMT